MAKTDVSSTRKSSLCRRISRTEDDHYRKAMKDVLSNSRASKAVYRHKWYLDHSVSESSI